LPEFYKGGAPSGVYALPDDSRQVWAVVGDDLMSSKDRGESWQKVFTGVGLRWIAVDPKNPKTFYVSGDLNVYRTTDGQKFTPIGGPHTGGRMETDSLGRLYVVSENASRPGLWRYDARAQVGSQWTRLLEDGTISGVAVDPTNPNRVAVTTNQNPYMEVSAATGVWISGDGGQSWSRQNNGLAMLRGFVLAFNPHDTTQLVWGSDGRGFWETRWPKTFAPKGTITYTQNRDDIEYSKVLIPSVPKLNNASMEDGSDLPGSWGKSWVGHGSLEVSRDTKVFKEGKASLRVRSIGDSQGQAAQTIDGAAGATFTVSGWVKTSGNVKVNFYVQSFDGGYKPVASDSFQQIGYVQNSSDWTQFSKTITLPDGTAHLRVGLLIEGEGQAWLDGVRLDAPH
jgi:hypothetical protein